MKTITPAPCCVHQFEMTINGNDKPVIFTQAKQPGQKIDVDSAADMVAFASRLELALRAEPVKQKNKEIEKMLDSTICPRFGKVRV
jgi:hypothetical protein